MNCCVFAISLLATEPVLPHSKSGMNLHTFTGMRPLPNQPFFDGWNRSNRTVLSQEASRVRDTKILNQRYEDQRNQIGDQ